MLWLRRLSPKSTHSTILALALAIETAWVIKGRSKNEKSTDERKRFDTNGVSSKFNLSKALSPWACNCEANTSFISPVSSPLLTQRTLTRRITNSLSKNSLDSKYKVDWGEPLGIGGYGSVYVATDLSTGERVACKQISKKFTDDLGFQREMEAFFHVRDLGGHPNICSLRETFDEGGNYYLILDLISGGEMFDHLINNGPYSEADAARLVREVASAVSFIHGVGCVHGDLKPENLMLSSENTGDAVVKLIDFGCAQVTPVDGSKGIPTSIGNTIAYSPPEVLRRENTSSRMTDDKIESSFDMWSLGVIVYIMLTGYHPFDLDGGSPDSLIAWRVMRSDKDPLSIADSPYTEHLSESARDLIQKLLVYDPKDRLTAGKMLDHPWVRGETARTEKITNSDIRLSKIRAFKSGIEAKVFADMFTWSEEEDSATNKASLIERCFKEFDKEKKGFITSNDLRRKLQRQITGKENEEESLTLSGFSDLLAENMKNKFFQKDKVVYHEGDVGNEMFFINSGVVEISTRDGFKVKAKRGDFVGEGALLSPDGVRSATVKCITPVHAIEVNREYFEKYLSTSSAINTKLQETTKVRTLNRTKPILRYHNKLKLKEAKQGEILYTVGDVGQYLYILETGSVDLALEGATVSKIQPGSMFGEEALITGKVHRTSARCSSSQCIFYTMSVQKFHDALRRSQSLSTALHNMSCHRELQKAIVFYTKRPFPSNCETLREIFDLIDVKKSGSISLDNICFLLKNANPFVTNQEMREIINSLDLDNSKSINFDKLQHIFGIGKAHFEANAESEILLKELLRDGRQE